ncbi:DUF378 domain-containing protein [Candidatus Saccharibacteria bacterium]|jgi:Uncharacterized conserved protein|nr:DUF378 domain-containing protein [Candidatus Saccharibacteria bacterium]
MRMNFIDILAYLLVIIGGINWGLVGFFDYNLVDQIFGAQSLASRIIYGAVGLSALYLLFTFMRVNRER